jgi:hypothetical protein
MTELNKRRYPLLTMKTLLEFQKKHNIKSGLLVIQFNGPKANNEVSTNINNKEIENANMLGFFCKYNR